MAEEEESQVLESTDDEGGNEKLSAQDPVAGGGGSHFSAVETLFMLLPCMGVDLVELLLSFTGISLLLSFVDFGLAALFAVVFAFKGGYSGRFVKKRVVTQVGSFLAELVPILEMLPIRTIVMIWMTSAWNKELDLGLEEKKDKVRHFEEKAAEAVEKYLSRFG